MKLSDPIKIALRSFTASKMRFFLTVLGIVIGVAAVIMVMAIGASAQDLLFSQVEKVGSNLVGVLPGASEENGPPASAFGIVTTTLTNDDLDAIRLRSNAPHLSAASGYVSGSASIESPVESMTTSFQGVSPSMIRVESIEIASGRFFTDEEENNLSRVIVLGATKASDLFPNSSDPIGETVKLKGISFKVIGVLKERGSGSFSNPDTLVFVPLGTAQKLLLGIRYLNFIRGKVDDTTHVDDTISDITTLLRERHDIRDGDTADFSVRSTAAALDVLGKVTDILKYFLIAIASLSLIVGGIGIMNSMLISVSQRIREIGLRKAVGAKPHHIITQFLIESAAITAIGGIVGIITGILLAAITAAVIRHLGYDWQFIITFSSVLIGFAVSVSIGILFGLYPAFKASHVSPMESLRYE
jgi:putative ABC transport system permease protein